jgi:hypothetical protein
MAIFQFLNRNHKDSNNPISEPQAQTRQASVATNPNPSVSYGSAPVSGTASNSTQSLTPQQQQALAYLQSLSDEDKATFSFLNTLVSAMLGYTILDIPENDREDIIKQCTQIFSDYIFNFVEIKYGKTESLRIKAAQKYQDANMFNKFQELGEIFEEAFGSFIENLQSQTVAQTA